MSRMILRGKKVEINDGIKTLQHYLDTGTFWSHPRNKFLHVEMKRYHHQPAPLAKQDTADPRRRPNPVDAWNHLLKGIWYFAIQKFGCYGKSTASAVVRHERYLKMGSKARTAIARGRT